MEILLLFILNVFTGALIYLLLSLKIERNSSTFQEQKLKKEMGEIITEFNSTAERNITLLESRISALKRLMGETGTLKSMDITMDHKPEIEKIIHEKIPAAERIKKTLSGASGSAPDRIITKNAADIAEISFTGFTSDRKSAPDQNDNSTGEKEAVKSPVKKQNLKNLYNREGNFARDMHESPAPSGTRGGQFDYISDENIDIVQEDQSAEVSENPAELFLSAENKYTLIAELHGRGYSVEDLAAYSGLPAGEVRLVISLNK